MDTIEPDIDEQARRILAGQFQTGERVTAAGVVAAVAAAEARGRELGRRWEYFAGLAFAYYDAPEGTDDVTHAWDELAGAIKHYRAVGGPEPRGPDEIRPPAESTGGQTCGCGRILPADRQSSSDAPVFEAALDRLQSTEGQP